MRQSSACRLVPWLVLLFPFLLAGCMRPMPPVETEEGYRREPGQLPAGQQPEGACVSGFLYDDAGLVFVDAAANAPEGGAPVAGAGIRVINIDGEELSATVTSANGHFHVSGLPSGLLTVAANTGKQEDGLEARVSAFASADIRMGKAYPFGFDEASALALEGAPASALVLGLLNPLPKGTLVAPMGVDPEVANFDVTLAADSWFFMVDETPDAAFTHPVTYVLVDAASGAVSRVDDAFERPRVNHGILWQSSQDYLSFPGLTEEEFAAEMPFPEFVEGVASPEVVQAPLPQTEKLLLTAFDGAAAGAAALPKQGNDGVFVIIVNGMQERAGAMSVQRVYNYFATSGVSGGNIRVVDAGKENNPSLFRSRGPYADAFNRFEERIKQRLEQQLPSTLIVYIFGHGAEEVTRGPDGQDVTKITGDIKMEWADDVGWVSGFGLGVGKTSACKLRVIVDSCYAAKFMDGVRISIVSDEDSDPPDFIGFSAAGATESMYFRTTWDWVASLGNTVPGGDFTKAFFSQVFLENGDFTNALEPGTTRIAELGLTRQNPEALLLPNSPQRCMFDGMEGEVEPNEGEVVEGETVEGEVAEGEPFEPTNAGIEVGGVCYTLLPTDGLGPVGAITIAHTTGTDIPFGEMRFEFEVDAFTAESFRFFGDGIQVEGPFENGKVRISGSIPQGGTATIMVELLSAPGGDALQTFHSEFELKLVGVLEATSDTFTLPDATIMFDRNYVPESHFEPALRAAELLGGTPFAVDLGSQFEGLPVGKAIAYSANTQAPRVPGETTELAAASSGTTRNAGEKLLEAFPCGEGTAGFTVCPGETRRDCGGEYVVVSVALAEEVVMDDPVNFYTYGFVFDSDLSSANDWVPFPAFPNDFYQGTDRWYEAAYTPGNGWALKVTQVTNGAARVTSSIPSAAFAVVDEAVITLVVPAFELASATPRYRVTAFRHTGDFGANPPFNWSADYEPALDAPLAEVNRNTEVPEGETICEGEVPEEGEGGAEGEPGTPNGLRIFAPQNGAVVVAGSMLEVNALACFPAGAEFCLAEISGDSWFIDAQPATGNLNIGGFGGTLLIDVAPGPHTLTVRYSGDAATEVLEQSVTINVVASGR